jgi:hypothetical protein
MINATAPDSLALRAETARKVPIATVAKLLGIAYSPSGLVVCPIHEKDTNGSFKYYPSTNSFYCFGCKASGSVIDLIMLARKVRFITALSYIEQELLEKSYERTTFIGSRGAAKPSPAKTPFESRSGDTRAQSSIGTLYKFVRQVFDNLRANFTSAGSQIKVGEQRETAYQYVDLHLEDQTNEEILKAVTAIANTTFQEFICAKTNTEDARNNQGGCDA